MHTYYNTFIFDWDGTLTKSIPIWYRAIREPLDDLSLSLTDSQIAEHFLGGWNTDTTDAMKHVGITDSQEFSDVVVQRAVSYGVGHAGLHDGVHALLQTMSEKGAKTGLVTNNFRNVVAGALDHHGLTDMFRAVITRNEAPEGKPHPGGIKKALDIMQDSAQHEQQALFIGDTKHDVDAARAAGIATAIFFPLAHESYYSYTMIKGWGADYIIREWEELGEL